MAERAETFDIAGIATQWIELFGDDAPEKAQRKADALSKTGDDTGAEWHNTISVVAQYLLARTPK